MTDSRFAKTVLLICFHDADHAMGVIVNRPLAALEFGDLLEQLDIDPRPGVSGDTVHYGGPVQTDRGVVVHSLDYRTASTLEVSEEFGLTATREVLVDIASSNPGRPPPERYFLAVGHAGWDAGQLESEIAVNAWAFCDASPDLVFCNKPENTWRLALKRLGVTAAMFSKEWSQIRDDDAPLN